MTQFLDILPETVTGEILPLLSHNDLLRLRRVCKATKFLAEDYISMKGRPISTEIELVDRKRSIGTDQKKQRFALAEFLELDPCPSSTSFFYNICHYQNEALPTFQNRFGHQITHLRVPSISIPHLKNEVAFFQALPNVTHLTVEEMATYLPAFDHRRGVEWELLKGSDFPNLTHLTVNRDISESLPHFYCLWKIFLNAPKLQSIKYPDYTGFPSETIHGLGQMQNRPLVSVLYDRQRKAGFPQIKSIDIQNFDDMNSFHELCRFAHDFSITLWNVNPAFFLVSTIMPFTVGSLSGGLHREMFSTDMPNLRRIELGVESTLFKRHYLPFRFAELQRRGEWENLGEIDVVVNGYLEQYGQIDWKGLFDFLFKDIEREAVTQLAIRYQFQTPEPEPPMPRVKNIVESCGNISKLTLVGWPGTNKALSKLWNGLPLLESVTLENIPTLGNVGFVGEDEENPAFRRLDRLKSVRLLKLCEMPKVTDTVFKLVFCHLPLKEFQLQGDRNLLGVTADGIRALLQGRFAETIEKFPFNNWKLNDVSEEEFQILEKKFRSSQMM